MWGAVDLDGNNRIFYGASSPTVDMGAYEHGSFRFKITEALFEGTGVVLSWNSRPGDTYSVWSSSGLSPGEWYEEETVESWGEITGWLDPSSTVGRKFYRIELR
jgi:hypothetical protein